MIDDAEGLVSSSSIEPRGPDVDGVLDARSSRRSTSCSNEGDGGPLTEGEFEAESGSVREKTGGTISVCDVIEDRWVPYESK